MAPLRALAFILVATMAATTAARAQEPTAGAVATRLAREMADATLKGSFETVIDHTYPPVVRMLGGREAAIRTSADVFKRLAEQGMSITSYAVSEPTAVLAEGAHTFAVLPTKMEMKFKEGRILSKSYILGISADGGKSWTFIDGSGINSKTEKILPKLPEKLVLPKKEDPQVIKD